MWVKVQNYFTPNNGSRGSQPCCGRMDTPASTYSKVHIEFLVRPSTPWGFPHSSVSKESACSAGNPGSIPGSGRSWRRDRLPTPVFLGFPCGSAGKESACNSEDLGSNPRLGRSPGERKGYPLQYSGLENSMDYSLWGCIQSDTTEQPSLNEGEILFKKPDFTMAPCFLRFSRPGQ